MSTHDRIKKFLVATLPDMREEERIDDVAAGVHEAMIDDWSQEYADAFGIPADAHTTQFTIDHEPVRGYLVKATHSRLTGPGRHEFTGEVPMVRVSLPRTHTDDVVAESNLGLVVAGDHKLYSLKVFQDYYGSYFGPINHVELITPVRYAGHRFAAVAIYLVYTDGNLERPSAFVFEAGMATGQPMVLYASQDMRPIVRKAGYSPTPFASVDHIYTGSLTMNHDEPTAFRVEIRKRAHDPSPFFVLSATLERKDDLVPVNPFALTLQAALRVCAIADARGEQVPDLGPLTAILAPLGRAQSWTQEPQR